MTYNKLQMKFIIYVKFPYFNYSNDMKLKVHLFGAFRREAKGAASIRECFTDNRESRIFPNECKWL